MLAEKKVILLSETHNRPLVSWSLTWAIKPFQICPNAPSPGSRILIQGEPNHPTSPLFPHLLTPLPGSPRQALAWLSSAIPQPWPQWLLSLLLDSGEARLAPSHPSVKTFIHFLSLLSFIFIRTLASNWLFLFMWSPWHQVFYHLSCSTLYPNIKNSAQDTIVNGKVLVIQLCLTRCEPRDCRVLCPWNSPGKWVPFSLSRGLSWHRNQTRVSCLQADSLPSESPGKLQGVTGDLLSFCEWMKIEIFLFGLVAKRWWVIFTISIEFRWRNIIGKNRKWEKSTEYSSSEKFNCGCGIAARVR